MTRTAFSSVRRAVAQFGEDEITHHAAALTYYALLSLFPALLLATSLLGLLGSAGTVDQIGNYLAGHGAPAATVDAARSAVRTTVRAGGGTSGLLLVFSLAIALNGASGAFGAAGRALRAVYGVDDERGFVRGRLAGLGWTFVVIGLGLLAIVLVFVGGGVADDLLGTIGLGSTGALLWSVLRWPAAFAVAVLAFELVYARAPGDARELRWVTAGGLTGVAVWLAGSAAFSFYVSNFNSYNATYGAFGAAIVLLVWLWLSSVALLLGAEVDALRAEDRALDMAGR